MTVSPLTAVHHQQALDEHRLLLHQLADAERVERVPGVGRELDAGADLAELARLLEHEHAEALNRQAERAARPPMPPPAMTIGSWLRGALIVARLGSDRSSDSGRAILR